MELYMERIRVSSSNLAAIGYDPDTETLEVEFLNATIYEHKNVPQMVYEELMNSSSHGTYYNRTIKNVYPHSRIS